VRGQVREFARDFAHEVVPDLPADEIDAVAERLLASRGPFVPPALLFAAPPMLLDRGGPLRLEFRHDCK
jgi:hypothetical protein